MKGWSKGSQPCGSSESRSLTAQCDPGNHTFLLFSHSHYTTQLSCVRLFAIPCTVAGQAPQSTGFSRQEYWSGLPFPSPGESSQPRDRTLVSHMAGRSFIL